MKGKVNRGQLCAERGDHFRWDFTVDLLGGRLGTDADQVVAVQAVVHIDAVAVEMEVKDAGFAVCMECDDVLGGGYSFALLLRFSASIATLILSRISSAETSYLGNILSKSFSLWNNCGERRREYITLERIL